MKVKEVKDHINAETLQANSATHVDTESKIASLVIDVIVWAKFSPSATSKDQYRLEDLESLHTLKSNIKNAVEAAAHDTCDSNDSKTATEESGETPTATIRTAASCGMWRPYPTIAVLPSSEPDEKYGHEEKMSLQQQAFSGQPTIAVFTHQPHTN